MTRALNQVHTLYPYTRDEVINTTGDDAALLFPPKPSSMCEEPLLVQTIDYIKTLICDPFIMGKIAAMHALSDIFAMNASPVSALALCVIPLADDEIVSVSLYVSKVFGHDVFCLADGRSTATIARWYKIGPSK